MANPPYKNLRTNPSEQTIQALPLVRLGGQGTASESQALGLPMPTRPGALPERYPAQETRSPAFAAHHGFSDTSEPTLVITHFRDKEMRR